MTAARKVAESVANVASVADPEPLRRPVAPPTPYPINELGHVLGPAAKALQEAIQAPAALCGQSILAAASLAVQPHADVLIDGRRYPTTLWMLTVAESGERKSAVDKIALDPHVKHERTRIDINASAMASFTIEKSAYDAAVEMAKRGTKGKTPDEIRKAIQNCGQPPLVPPSGIKIVREPTIEAVQKIMLSGASALGLFADEGAEFIGGHSMSKEHKMRTIGGFSKLWDDGTSDRIRAGDGAAKIFGRRLAMHLMMQPIVAEGLLADPMLSGQGFLARALLSSPATTAGTRAYKGVDASTSTAMQTYNDRIAKLLELEPATREDRPGELSPRALTLTVEAKREWIEVYNTLEKSMTPGSAYAQIRPWVSKAAEQVLRIAGVLTMVDNASATQISASTIVSASKLVAHYLSEAARLADTAEVKPEVRHAELILDWCRHRGSELIDSRTLLQHGPNCCRSDEAMTAAMGVLVRAGWATSENGASNDGRKVRRAWRVRIDIDPLATLATVATKPGGAS